MSRFRWLAIQVVSLSAVLVLAALLLPGIGTLSSRVHAADGSGQAYLFQDDYPPADDSPTLDPAYPSVPTDSSEPIYPSAPTDTAPEPGEDSPTQPAADTPIPVDTPLPPAVQTETISAMQTQAANASPTAPTGQAPFAGTGTPVETPTVPALGTRPVVTLTPSPEKSGGIDWGLFWIGFSVPVLAASGVVLYLLDRQPMLLQRRGKKP